MKLENSVRRKQKWQTNLQNALALCRHRFWLAVLVAPLGCDSPAQSNIESEIPIVALNNSNALLPLVDIHGIEQHPFEAHDAKATVLVFTMQDCPIANSYAPTLNKFHDEYGARGIRLLLVHVDPAITDEVARKHADEYQIRAPVIVDRQHSWVKLAGATRSPEVAILSPAGKILYSGRIDDKYVGFGKRRTHVTTHDLVNAVDAILADRPVSTSKSETIGCYIPPLPTGE
jgi:hypothetical protein